MLAPVSYHNVRLNARAPQKREMECCHDQLGYESVWQRQFLTPLHNTSCKACFKVCGQLESSR